MHVAAPAAQAEVSAVRSLYARGFYVGAVGLMIGVVLLGFWPFYSALFRGGTGAHWVIYLHAAVFSGWMLLLLAQVVLVFRRRVRLHQKLGAVGIYYGLLVLLMGLVISIAAPALNVMAGRQSLDEAAGFLILPLGDMLLFGGFFAAGVWYRRRKETHKRLMLLATIALMFAPAGRLGGEIHHVAVLLIWLFPLFLAMAHDVATRRRVERVYLVGFGVMMVAFARVWLVESEAWLAMGRPILLALIQS